MVMERVEELRMDDFLKYTGKDILDMTDEEFVRELLGDEANKDEAPKPVDFDKINEEYQEGRGSYRDFEMGEDKMKEDMTDEEFEKFLDEKFPDYPKDTPDAFKKIGVENWWW